jgi:tetratricopeptide (TPR) repeat protein
MSGFDIAAMESLLQALSRRPERNDLRGECIRLAGQLGRVSTLQELVRPLSAPLPKEEHIELYLDYLDALRLNGQYTSAASVYSRLLDNSWSHNQYRERILLHQSETLKWMGNQFASQRILRTLLVTGNSDRKLIAQLIAHALDSGPAGDGWALLEYYNGKHGEESWKNRFDNESMQLFLSYIRLLAEEGRVGEAIEELNDYLTQSGKRPDSGKVGQGSNALELELCRLYIAAGKKDECRTVITQSWTAARGRQEILLMQRIVLGEGIADLNSGLKTLPGISDKTGGIQALFTLAEQAETFADENAALILYSKILELQPESMRARVGLAKVFKKAGRLAEASSLYKRLWHDNPDEVFFFHEFLQLEFAGICTFIAVLRLCRRSGGARRARL